MVHGRRPPGSSSPNSTSASARPPSWPGSQPHSTAGTDDGPRQVDRRPGQHDDDRARLDRRHRLASAPPGGRAAPATRDRAPRSPSRRRDRSRPRRRRPRGRRPPRGRTRRPAPAARTAARRPAAGADRRGGRPAPAARARRRSARSESPTGTPSAVSVASPLVLTLNRCAPLTRGREGCRRSGRPAASAASSGVVEEQHPEVAGPQPWRAPRRRRRGSRRRRPAVPSARRRSAPSIAGVPRLAVGPGLDHDRRRPAARAARRPPWRRRWA